MKSYQEHFKRQTFWLDRSSRLLTNIAESINSNRDHAKFRFKSPMRSYNLYIQWIKRRWLSQVFPLLWLRVLKFWNNKVVNSEREKCWKPDRRHTQSFLRYLDAVIWLDPKGRIFCLKFRRIKHIKSHWKQVLTKVTDCAIRWRVN